MIHNNLTLLLQLSRQQLLSRHAGSFLGVFWLLIQPLAMLVVYAFVFSGILGLKWPNQASPDMLTFALGVMCGMLVFGFVSEVAIKSSTSILANPNFVKKVQFPLHVLVMSHWLTSLLLMLVSLVILVLGLIVAGIQPNISLLFLPFVLLPIILLMLGVAWIVAGLSVYLRDIVQVLPPLMTMLMFLSPIFYSLSMVPEHLQQVILMNPLTWHIESVRNLLMSDQLPSLLPYCIWLAFALLLNWVGFKLFQKLKKGFSDVI